MKMKPCCVHSIRIRYNSFGFPMCGRMTAKQNRPNEKEEHENVSNNNVLFDTVFRKNRISFVLHACGATSNECAAVR